MIRFLIIALFGFPLVAFSADNCGVGDEELCSMSELNKICSDNDLKYEKDVQQIDDAVTSGDCNGCCSIFSRLEAKNDFIDADDVDRWMDTGEQMYCVNRFKDKLAGTRRAAIKKCGGKGETVILANGDEIHFSNEGGFIRKPSGWGERERIRKEKKEKICSAIDLKYERDVQQIYDAAASGDCNECCEKVSLLNRGRKHEETAKASSCPADYHSFKWLPGESRSLHRIINRVTTACQRQLVTTVTGELFKIGDWFKETIKLSP